GARVPGSRACSARLVTLDAIDRKIRAYPMFETRSPVVGPRKCRQCLWSRETRGEVPRGAQGCELVVGRAVHDNRLIHLPRVETQRASANGRVAGQTLSAGWNRPLLSGNVRAVGDGQVKVRSGIRDQICLIRGMIPGVADAI